MGAQTTIHHLALSLVLNQMGRRVEQGVHSFGFKACVSKGLTVGDCTGLGETRWQDPRWDTASGRSEGLCL